jgi:putative DNA primase/helicase
MKNKVDKFLNRLENVTKTATNQYKAKCPAHDDKVESFSVNITDDKINFYCHAGCSEEDILSEMNLKWSDLFFNEQKKEIVKTYNYTDKEGELLYPAVRSKPQSFRQRRPQPDGNGWAWNLGNTQRVLYNLPAVLKAVNTGQVVYIVEGEKDADNLIKEGLTATTAPMGAGKWEDNYTKTLTGAKVVIIPDNDKAGKKHARNIANKLHGKAKSVKILQLPGLAKKEDVTDWLNKGFDKDDLLQLLKDCPTYKPGSQQGERHKQFEDFLPSPIAREIIKQEKEKGRLWKYVAEKELFYLYNNTGYWKSANSQYLKKIIRKALYEYNSKWDKRHNVQEIIEAMKSLLLDPENVKLFDAGQNPNTRYINLKKGMLDWENDKLLSHDPEYYSQFQLPINYNPDQGCPNWKQALKQWVPEKEARQFLQEFVGYCLIPDTSMHKAVILHGTGSNGKSTFLNVLTSLFGEENLSSIPLHRLSERFETANIQDKLVNICPDIDPTYLKETGILKTMIAGEKLRGEYKYGASFDFNPVIKLIFSANEIPKARDKTEAWYRRFEIVKFPNKFRKTDPGFDPHLEEKLKKELPGILNWSIKGLKRLKEQRHFTQSKLIKEAKREYERENDTVVAFIEDMTDYPEENYEVGQEVYEEYQRYCEGAGMKYTSRRTFTSKLKKLGFEVKPKWSNGKTKRCYYGLKLIS